MPARRLSLGALVLILLILGGTVLAGVTRGGWDPAPKLALDLEGGTQVILQASTTDGSTVDAQAMEQARQIIAQRVNAMGVAETEISVQGGTNIVVDVPGQLDEATREALSQTAALSFRPVLGTVAPEGTGAPSDAGGATDPSVGTFSGPVSLEDPYAPATSTATGTGASDGTAAQETGTPAPWSMDWISSGIQNDVMQVDCTDPSLQQEKASQAPASLPVVACAPDGSAKFVLGPTVVAGSSIVDAGVGPETTPTGQSTGFYVVNMTFDAQGGEAFGAMTQALYGQEGATTQFGILLDGLVISAPVVQAPTSTNASITGSFTQDQATQLANQLKFGALPLQFEVQSEQQISATLGGDQLQKGLLAGLIGLVLVVIYAALQYRTLAIVTTSSLLVMGVLAYLVMTILSHIPEIGYRLSLAGVAGLIVAIAFTADSFIVYFERVRDEIRDGRGIVASVDHGWDRAKRTILASDAVNLIAAVVLYLLSTGGVRGFAFTLGLTTLLDLLVVFLFTHPLLQALVRTRFFGKGHPMSGLDPALLGRSVPAYAGRGRIRSGSERADASERSRSGRGDRDAAPRETLAERKARLAREAQPSPEADRTAPDDSTDRSAR